MHQHVLELEVLFVVHSVCSGTITHYLDLERVVYDQHFLQFDSWVTGKRESNCLLGLTVTYAFPAHTSGFALQILDLTQTGPTGIQA